MKKIFWSLFGVLLGILVLHLWQRVEVRITFDLPECKSEEDKITGCVAKEYYENGGLWRELPLKDFMLDGVFKEYSQDGNLIATLTFQNHKFVHGECVNGKALQEENIQRGNIQKACE